jgi:hypothetical protein
MVSIAHLPKPLLPPIVAFVSSLDAEELATNRLMTSSPEQRLILELTRQELHDLWLACCDGRKHKRYRMETPNGWPVANLARVRSALLRLKELEKRLGHVLLGRDCKNCGANPCSDFFTEVDGPIQPMLCERCELELAAARKA